MARDPWRVGVARLRRSPGSQISEQPRGKLGELVVADSRVDADSEVEADLVLTAVLGGVEVAGHVRVPWEGVCRRCGTAVHGDLDAEVRELYRVKSADDDDDDESYPLGTEDLDLRPLARDAVLLDLPLAPLCRSDCRGLCPICGADLNQGECTCERVGGDLRWAALDAFGSKGGGAAV
ncbi:MAG: YceD family protein [Acidimicrobiales bacterium]